MDAEAGEDDIFDFEEQHTGCEAPEDGLGRSEGQKVASVGLQGAPLQPTLQPTLQKACVVRPDVANGGVTCSDGALRMPEDHDAKIISDEHAVRLVTSYRDDYVTHVIQDRQLLQSVAGGGEVPGAPNQLASEATTVGKEAAGETDEPLDEEDLYDKFVPTDPSKVEEYKKKMGSAAAAAAAGADGAAADGDRRANIAEYIITEPSGQYGDDTIRIERPIGVYTPPENFALVGSQIYRSAFPRVENFEFISALNIKSVLCLIPEEYPAENIELNKEQGIQFFQVGLSGNKEPFVKIKPELVTEALKIITNPANRPILIHCNRGKHRTGCIVGCVRRLQKWSLSMIFDEYRKFAYPKERPLDQQFIEMYNEEEVVEYATKQGWLPLPW